MIKNEYINRAIDYILTHINEDLTVEDIARHCNFSKHYFSRMFKMETGESVYEFIKRIKMEQSAFRLKIEKGRSITDVGIEYGYSPSNYSSAFKNHHNLTPVEFRRSIQEKSLNHPLYKNVQVELESFERCSQKISVEILPDRKVIFERHKGIYSDLSIHWCEFLDRYNAYIAADTLQIEFTYNDPSITDVNECLYELCLTVPEECSLENTYVLKGGKFAVYHYKGDVAQIYTAFQNIFNVWLPQTNYKIDERYGFEIYRKVEPDTSYLEIDLCIPISG